MEQHTLTVAAHRLGGISLFTLRQWCKAAGIDLEQQKSLADPRQKWLTDEQVKLLAQAHGRILDQHVQATEPIPPNAYKLLVEKVAQVAQQAEQINANHAPLLAGLAELREQIGAATREQEQAQLQGDLDTLRTQELEPLAAQLAALQQTQATMQQEQAALHQQVERLGEQWSHVSSFQSDVTELRGRFHTQRADIEKYQKQTGAALEQITTGQQKAAARLDALAATNQKQAEREQEIIQQLDIILETGKLTRTLLKEIDTQQQQATTRIDSLVTTAGRQQQEIAALQAQAQQASTDLDNLTTAMQEQLAQAQARMQAQLEQMQAAMQEQVQRTEQRLLAQFQAALATLQQQMQAQAQAAEQRTDDLRTSLQQGEKDQARDVADLNYSIRKQQEQLTSQIENATTKAEAATTTALGSQRRIDSTEQRLTHLAQQIQVEQAARTILAERVNQLVSQAPEATTPEQSHTAERKKPGRKPKQDSGEPTQ
jgi:chromosome segregation ATPase